MGNESKYKYIYYTVIDTERWRRGNEEWLGYDDDEVGFTWDKAVNFINHKFKTSEDKDVNNYRVDYAEYNHNIENWRNTIESYDVHRPIFVKFHYNQEIKITGEGSMFVLYEEEEESYYTQSDNILWPPPDADLIDGLAAAGGRL